MNTNFKKLRNIGDSEPRAWTPSATHVTKFSANEDCYEDEVPAPYCNDSDEELCSDEEDDNESEDVDEEIETETETESTTSIKKRGVIFLQEETDFMQE